MQEPKTTTPPLSENEVKMATWVGTIINFRYPARRRWPHPLHRYSPHSGHIAAPNFVFKENKI